MNDSPKDVYTGETHKGLPVVFKVPSGFLSMKEFAIRVKRSVPTIHAAVARGRIDGSLCVYYNRPGGKRFSLMFPGSQVEVFKNLPTKNNKPAANQDQSKKTEALPEYPGGVQKELTKVKLEHERVKKEQAELQLSLAKGEAISVERVRAEFIPLVIESRQSILAIPSRIAPSLIGQTKITKVVNILEKELRRSLQALSKIEKFDGRKT